MQGVSKGEEMVRGSGLEIHSTTTIITTLNKIESTKEGMKEWRKIDLMPVLEHELAKP